MLQMNISYELFNSLQPFVAEPPCRIFGRKFDRGQSAKAHPTLCGVCAVPAVLCDLVAGLRTANASIRFASHRLPAYAVVRESSRQHCLRIVEIATVEDHPPFHPLAHLSEIGATKF